ncbi:ParB N-terminal domain-containing protein [Streptomyces sp. B6B3]|uniref:ParB/RepB/Spo0J family partition protein n=1 Tax=Streptomyces sp. B6B3 TaxID=3153570 RepID=UPI00325CDA2C
MRPVSLPVAVLRTADSPRRGGEDPEHIRLLAAAQGPLPPITVHRATMRVIDGMHRLRAAQSRGSETIRATFFEGDEADAYVLGVRLNIQHGLPLSREDRLAAARRIMASHPDWSDRLIASATGLAASTVAGLRRRSTDIAEQSNRRIGQDGRVRPLSAAEGRRRAADIMAREPAASLRDVAARAGIALGTAKDVRDRLRRGQSPLPDGSGRPGNASVAATGAPAAATRPDPSEPSRLLRDPALRYTDQGRLLLRLIHAHPCDDREWESMARAVPTSQATTVARLAREFARQWKDLADLLELPLEDGADRR